MSANLRDKIAALKRLNLTDRQVCDLELLLDDSFAPLKGYLDEADYRSVVESMRLADGTLWPIPVALDVRADCNIEPGEEILLCDKYGNPLAVLNVSSIYYADKQREAEQVYRTADQRHPGVWRLFNDVGNRYLGGRLTEVVLSERRRSFADLRHSPAELKDWFKANGWEKIIGFQTRNPIHRAHYELMRRGAEEHGAKILIHPTVGETKPGDIDAVTRVRCYRKVADSHMSDFAKLSLLPLAMRMAGPREALWHAIIRKNYGCTHFIVGRNHADPGLDFYGPYDAQELVKKHEAEIGISVIPMAEIAYVPSEKKYFYEHELEPHHEPAKISGTELRRMIREGEEVPEWLSFPEIVAELRLAVQLERQRGVTIFLTGLSSSGKSTVAKILRDQLTEMQPRAITLLDGDVVRENLSKGLGFSREDRDTNILRIGFVASEITRHGGICICAAIAPYAAARSKNRELISRNGTYIEVLVDTPVEVCKERDVKGLYRKAELGQLKNFTGVDDPFERSADAEIRLDTVHFSPEQCAQQVIGYLLEQGLIGK
ncbi:MAG: bifunctional sulfate adenylyltransferase/adenylylsulfate kinase [Patescibacteria group bacterium]